GGSAQRIGWDGATVEQLKLALPEACGLGASRFFFHIVAIILQVKQKKQFISECENRTRFRCCLSLRRKGHPSGGIHAPWYLSSEIAASFPRDLARPIAEPPRLLQQDQHEVPW